MIKIALSFLLIFYLAACSQHAENGDPVDQENHAFDPVNYKYKIDQDTISFPEEYQNSCVRLTSTDYFQIFKQKKILENQTDEVYYFHSLIKNTSEEKIITLIEWNDGGYACLLYLIIKPKSIEKFILAEVGEEEDGYSVLKGDTLTTIFKYTPMATEWFDDKISNIGFYWDEYKLTTSKYKVVDGHPKLLSNSSKEYLSNLNLYASDESQGIYDEQINAANALLSSEKLENYEQVKKLALGKALEIQKKH